MSLHPHDIFPENNEGLSQDDLLKYLEGNTKRTSMHDIEKNLLDDVFAQEAIEGLQAIDEKKKIISIANEIDHDLRKKLRTEKRRKPLGMDNHFAIIGVILIILLSVVAWYIIHQLRR